MAESQTPSLPSNQEGGLPAQPQADTHPQAQTREQPPAEEPSQSPVQSDPTQSSQPSQPSQEQPTEQPQTQQQQPQQQPSGSERPAETATSSASDDMAGLNDKEKQDVVMGGTEEDGGNNTAQTGAAGAGPASSIPAPGAGINALEAGILPPRKKDTSLREFLSQMDEYAPIIPDAVTAHYLTVAGLPPPGPGPNQTPPHLARLLALATQKFIADIAADAYQYARIRNSNSSSSSMGAINVAAGLNIATQGQSAAGGGAGGAGGTGTEAGKGKSSAGLHLGVQRPGYGGGGHGGSQGKTVLTMEDLGMAVAEYGVSVKRGEFYR
ncbi:hypothetical protein VTO42DRAFT_2059 [Malbranchea cinnamomea]